MATAFAVTLVVTLAVTLAVTFAATVRIARCTHESIAARLPDNPHWHVATEAGVLATEEILAMLLKNATASSAADTADTAKLEQ